MEVEGRGLEVAARGLEVEGRVTAGLYWGWEVAARARAWAVAVAGEFGRVGEGAAAWQASSGW